MQRRIAVLGGLVALLMTAAPSAWAINQAFNVNVPINQIGPVTAGVPMDQDTGLVGFCDPQLQCTGFRASAYTTEVSGGTSAGQVTLNGYVCVMDSSPQCTSNPADPFTGVKIVERYVDAPEAQVDPFVVHVNFCLWVMSPQDTPHGCNVPAFAPDETAMPDTGNLAEITEIVPPSIGLHFTN
jgi:hypothetical protein